jgi:HD-GYP domain-containing protein (c-di-GMP phosphodiesterase class II)
MAVETEDAFQKELIDLFVQEAQEWLQQIHVALDELQQGPAAERHIKLAHTIRAGLTNLGGSAATIGLDDVERASFSALPFVEAVQDPAVAIAVNDFIVLCKQLGHIHTALTRATGVTFDAETAEVCADSVPVTMSSRDLLQVLYELQQRQAGHASSSRNLVQIVIAQVQGLMHNGVAQCDAASMRQFLDRLGETEDAFYGVVQQHLPAVADGFGRLRQDGPTQERTPEGLRSPCRDACSSRHKNLKPWNPVCGRCWIVSASGSTPGVQSARPLRPCCPINKMDGTAPLFDHVEMGKGASCIESTAAAIPLRIVAGMPAHRNGSSMSWYRDAEAELARVASAIQAQHPFRMEALESLAASLVSALKQNDRLIVEALSSPSGSPLITNLINVAILGTKVGIGLGYYGRELEGLALAGLVHDVGLFAVPQSLVTKAGRLTVDERMLIEQHPELGYQVLHRFGPQYDWLAQIVRQAHERSNGLGYPNRLKGRQIGEMAQILGVVDVFDALVSERPYRHRLLPHEAVKELLVAERSTFPREIMKALVEQLSVYPLGTTVRLTTGEKGTVVRVNVRYPLRPTVRISEEPSGGGALTAREVDISLTPLVSIIETLTPPAVGQVSFSEGTGPSPGPAPVVVASDHFTSLLESLDAIATAIQGVVETRIPASQAAVRVEREQPAVAASAPSTDTADATFRHEIVGLFALEAHEWLAQIQTALKKLSHGAERPFRSKLYGFILNGITNLAKSASTVELDEIEAMASNLLPLLRDVGGASVQPMPETLRRLQSGLDRITAAVQRLAQGQSHDGPKGEMVEADPPVETGNQAQDHLNEGTAVCSPHRVASSMPLLSALRDLQQARARSLQPPRDVLEAVIERAEQEGGEQPDRIDVGAIERILHDLNRLDEEFLREVRDRVPVMTSALMQLREQGSVDFVTATHLDPILTHVEALCELSKPIHAATITMFLQGLKTFFSLTAYRQAAMLPQHLEAIAERLNALIPMAEQWVILGRLERAAIEEILPV